jgi:hypothetical protein
VVRVSKDHRVSFVVFWRWDVLVEVVCGVVGLAVVFDQLDRVFDCHGSEVNLNLLDALVHLVIGMCLVFDLALDLVIPFLIQ